MKSLSENAIRLARVLIAIVFVLNAIGIIDQTIPAKEIMERGVPAAIVPWLNVCPADAGVHCWSCTRVWGFPANSSSGALCIPCSRNAGFAFLLVVGRHTVVHGPADQFLEKPGDLWGTPIHRRKLEPAPGDAISTIWNFGPGTNSEDKRRVS
jgi:hypothetical protein